MNSMQKHREKHASCLTLPFSRLLEVSNEFAVLLEVEKWEDELRLADECAQELKNEEIKDQHMTEECARELNKEERKKIEQKQEEEEHRYFAFSPLLYFGNCFCNFADEKEFFCNFADFADEKSLLHPGIYC